MERLVLAIGAVVGMAVPVGAQLCGDVNGDGAVDAIDAANVARAAVGLPSAQECATSDAQLNCTQRSRDVQDDGRLLRGLTLVVAGRDAGTLMAAC